MADEPRKPRIRSRRIVDRPRLIRALDRSRARVRMLVADPGWGKTTLAEQWAAAEGRRVGWYRARRSAADVSVVARALVAAADEVVPGAGRRLLQRLAVTDDPEREATLLAEMLAEDLEVWPADAWMLVDDYEYLAASTASEAFVETVSDQSGVQLLVAGSVRPSWVAAADILSGSALEVTETALAMSAEEAAEVLGEGRAGLGFGLCALTRGWPAVIGLAGMTPDAGVPDAEQPDALYDFFADQLYRGLDPTVRTGLAVLAEMPLVDRELATAILGQERAEEVCDEGVRLGILDERGGGLEFHPLSAAFLERQVWGKGSPTGLVANASEHYRDRGELDAAFDLTRRAGRAEDVERLVSESMNELLDTARLPTLGLWVSQVEKQLGENGTVLLAHAEIALRQGRHLTAQALAERVSHLGDLSAAYRASLVGGRAAHVGSREEDALDLYTRAEEVARHAAERRNAQWGQLTAAIDLELGSALTLLRELGSTSDPLNPTEAIQAADKTLAYGLRFGAVENLADAKRVAELLTSVPDPFLRSSFGSTFSCALNLAADYQQALTIATEMIRDATEFRVQFAIPYGFLARGTALAGLRRFDEATESLDCSLAAAVRCTDSWAQQSVYAARIRALLHEGRIPEACALEPPDLTDSLPAIRGEVWASRGLALACMGRLAEAKRCAEEVRGSTRAVEPNTLDLAIDAVVGIKGRDPALRSSLRRLVSGAFAAGAVDFVVTSYRANPELLAALLRDNETAESTGYIVARADDHALAKSIGLDAIAAVDPVSSLSPREREIYDLLCEGLSNSEIARRLFISQATVKVHARHVYDKLGIRSRTALALNAASRRSHAKPTAAGNGESATSDEDG